MARSPTDESAERSNSPAPSLLDLVRGFVLPTLGDLASKAADSLLPHCAVCGETAVPLPCLRCGGLVCLAHGYFRVAGLVPGRPGAHAPAGPPEALCRACVVRLLQGSGEPTEGLSPYEVLGVAEDATAEQIRSAFRVRSKTCHADRYPGDREKAAEFSQLQWAREAALEGLKA